LTVRLSRQRGSQRPEIGFPKLHDPVVAIGADFLERTTERLLARGAEIVLVPLMQMRMNVRDDEARQRRLRNGVRQVAIAYVTEDHIGLRSGDILVCDANDSMIRKGQTGAKLLRRLHRNGMAIYSVAGLHAKVMHTSKVVKGLLDRGVFKTITQRHPIKRNMTTVIPNEEIERFKTTYVSLFTLARERGKHMPILLREPECLGIRPATELNGVGATFFKRSEVPPP
jgi:hypothetical protein